LQLKWPDIEKCRTDPARRDCIERQARNVPIGQDCPEPLFDIARREHAAMPLIAMVAGYGDQPMTRHGAWFKRRASFSNAAPLASRRLPSGML
jgi:hypothetical protein